MQERIDAHEAPEGPSMESIGTAVTGGRPNPVDANSAATHQVFLVTRCVTTGQTTLREIRTVADFAFQDEITGIVENFANP